MQPITNKHQWMCYLFYPSIVFAIITGAIEFFHIDLILADWLFHWEQLNTAIVDSWPLRHNFITQIILHDYGHKLVVLLAITVLMLTCFAWKQANLYEYRYGFLYLLISFLLTVVVIGILKKYTHVNCPWDLLRYGGEQVYVPTFESLPDFVKPGRCFPGGHATGGYAWIGIFFFCKVYAPRWRYWGLTAALVLGLIFDLTQQLRGAHFLSHGLWTLGISWFISASLYLLWFRRYGK